MSLAVGVYAFVFFFVGNETDFCQSDTISFFFKQKNVLPATAYSHFRFQREMSEFFSDRQK